MYSIDKNIQYLTYLLKAHGINKVIASPGTCDAAFVAGIQKDTDFTVFSCIDERSAAYLAVGIAEKSGSPVAITCTEATASRNYFSALTEAYYRKLPILALTFNHGEYPIGNLGQQSIDRTQQPKDTVIMSVNIRPCIDKRDENYNILKINKALLELNHHGGGPVHINICAGSMNLSVKELPDVRVIRRYLPTDTLPNLSNDKRIAILCMSHKRMSDNLTQAIDKFCAIHDAVVLCDHTSGYYGKYRVDFSLPLGQKNYKPKLRNIDLLIHIGEICAISISPKETWRLNEDGELRDTFGTLTKVFEMPEEYFFNYYASSSQGNQTNQLDLWNKEYEEIFQAIPDLPFSNIWCASQLAPVLPHDCTLHFSILNSLRSWNYFRIDSSITTNCNVGGFGIDGSLSTLIGASLIDSKHLHYMIIGDLSFFYDMNSLGIRHIGNNLRILLINNGKGTEFRLPDHPAVVLGDDADSFVAAAGHYGFQSRNLVKHYAQDLGFQYMSAENKDEFNQNLNDFIFNKEKERSIIFEIFTDTKNENIAYQLISNINISSKEIVKERIKEFAVNCIGQSNISMIKKIIGM